jgi:hypothetical protein
MQQAPAALPLVLPDHKHDALGTLGEHHAARRDSPVSVIALRIRANFQDLLLEIQSESGQPDVLQLDQV